MIGGGGTGAWQGDSGGPVYAQFDDDGWRTFGITSGGPGPGQAVYYVTMGKRCRGSNRSPGSTSPPVTRPTGPGIRLPECGGYATAPTAADSWANRCGAAIRSAPSTTCGDALLRRGEPSGGAHPAPGGRDGHRRVPRRRDDRGRGGRRRLRCARCGWRSTVRCCRSAPASPGTFTGTFPKGTYELVAVAQDWSGNHGGVGHRHPLRRRGAGRLPVQRGGWGGRRRPLPGRRRLVPATAGSA